MDAHSQLNYILACCTSFPGRSFHSTHSFIIFLPNRYYSLLFTNHVQPSTGYFYSSVLFLKYYILLSCFPKVCFYRIPYPASVDGDVVFSLVVSWLEYWCPVHWIGNWFSERDIYTLLNTLIKELPRSYKTGRVSYYIQYKQRGKSTLTHIDNVT